MIRRKAALLVGIDDYASAPLACCVSDAMDLQPLLSKNEDGDPNFDCVTLTAPTTGHGSGARTVTRSALREQLEKLFSHRLDVALFYFSGHGLVTSRGGFLVTQDASRYDEGVSMDEVLNLANKSKSDEVAIILDCCFSGKFGTLEGDKEGHISLREGVSVLAASAPTELAIERSGHGAFTELLCGALQGGAADVIGQVTAASAYAFVDQALGAWDQRPMFKANLTRLTPLRICQPEVEISILRKLTEYFPHPEYDLPLDPSYERDGMHKPPGAVHDPAKAVVFDNLQKCRAARLVVPVGEGHLFWAAIRSKACRLTALGRFYWKLAKENKL